MPAAATRAACHQVSDFERVRYDVDDIDARTIKVEKIGEAGWVPFKMSDFHRSIRYKSHLDTEIVAYDDEKGGISLDSDEVAATFAKALTRAVTLCEGNHGCAAVPDRARACQEHKRLRAKWFILIVKKQIANEALSQLSYSPTRARKDYSKSLTKRQRFPTCEATLCNGGLFRQAESHLV